MRLFQLSVELGGFHWAFNMPNLHLFLILATIFFYYELWLLSKYVTSHFGVLIEEFLGDLRECREQLKQEEKSKILTTLVSLLQAILFVFAICKILLDDELENVVSKESKHQILGREVQPVVFDWKPLMKALPKDYQAVFVDEINRAIHRKLNYTTITLLMLKKFGPLLFKNLITSGLSQLTQHFAQTDRKSSD